MSGARQNLQKAKSNDDPDAGYLREKPRSSHSSVMLSGTMYERLREYKYKHRLPTMSAAVHRLFSEVQHGSSGGEIWDADNSAAKIIKEIQKLIAPLVNKADPRAAPVSKAAPPIKASPSERVQPQTDPNSDDEDCWDDTEE